MKYMDVADDVHESYDYIVVGLQVTINVLPCSPNVHSGQDFFAEFWNHLFWRIFGYPEQTQNGTILAKNRLINNSQSLINNKFEK